MVRALGTNIPGAIAGEKSAITLARELAEALAEDAQAIALHLEWISDEDNRRRRRETKRARADPAPSSRRPRATT